MGSSFKCNICNRPMPPRVYEFHLKKSHTPEEVQSQIEENDQKLEKLGAFSEPMNTLIHDAAEKIREAKQFDWGEIYPCNSCGEEYPAKAMPFHSWVKHRV